MARYFNPVAQILTDSGRIAPGAKINFYVNNDTSTRQNTYADANLSVVNPNPVVMGADGRPQYEIFLPDDAIYTLVFTYSDDVQFAQVDDYTGANSDVVGILAALGITISASELQIDLDVDLNGDLDISGTSKLSTNNRALTGVASSGFPPADIPLIKANTSDQVEIDPDGNGALFGGNAIFASGQGADFSAAGGGVLDIYEGVTTFTPELADASAGGNTATGTFYGAYSRVGDLVFVVISLVNIDTTGLTGANDIFVRNLPYAASTAPGQASYTGGLFASSINFVTSPLVTLTPNLIDGQNFFRITETIDNANADSVIVSELTSGSADIFCSFAYLTDD